MQIRQCTSYNACDTVASWLVIHCILSISSVGPVDYKICGSHAGEIVSYASTRRGQFEAASDWQFDMWSGMQQSRSHRPDRWPVALITYSRKRQRKALWTLVLTLSVVFFSSLTFFFEFDVFHCEISQIWCPVLWGVVSIHKTNAVGNKTYIVLQICYL